MSVKDVTDLISKRTVAFVREFGISPTDVVLGPTEFNLLREQASLPDSDPSSKYRLELSVYFVRGMRLRLSCSDGVLVGVLTAKEQ